MEYKIFYTQQDCQYKQIMVVLNKEMIFEIFNQYTALQIDAVLDLDQDESAYANYKLID